MPLGDGKGQNSRTERGDLAVRSGRPRRIQSMHRRGMERIANINRDDAHRGVDQVEVIVGLIKDFQRLDGQRQGGRDVGAKFGGEIIGSMVARLLPLARQA